jgi:hypothetical protein
LLRFLLAGGVLIAVLPVGAISFPVAVVVDVIVTDFLVATTTTAAPAAGFLTVNQAVAVVIQTVPASRPLLVTGCRNACSTIRVGSVDQAVAVIVDTVIAIFRSSRVDTGIVIITIDGTTRSAIDCVSICI